MILLISPSICFHNIYIIKFDILIEEHLLQFQIFTTKGYWIMKHSTERAFLGEKEEKRRVGGNHLKTSSLLL